jgi:hypothetical protein
MKQKIDIDKKTGGPSLEERISALLKENKLPECLGNMSPPIISKIVNIDVDTILKHRKSIPKENIADSLRGDALLSDMIIDNEGIDYLKNIKETMAKAYVDKIIKCTTCQYCVLCDRLTTHYLNTINMEL